jgi:hypothetical protein
MQEGGKFSFEKNGILCRASRINILTMASRQTEFDGTVYEYEGAGS